MPARILKLNGKAQSRAEIAIYDFTGKLDNADYYFCEENVIFRCQVASPVPRNKPVSGQIMKRQIMEDKS
jgi:hypothetical protein